ncbi:nucleoside ABC transporter membrane protein [Paenibacillus taihuensis]|uniref:Nucleoside ABC transporter membrane protein n=1 Tax=Paenibacillus taihuensis TaxID=1156355 RepID=A0A3D9PZ32_9BACL|nr:ABC transporter permease [Paenibacillus taihuensis]REE55400.1 nucleoside ABC transporter membrane protein [Paenibacillus taihuensis]
MWTTIEQIFPYAIKFTIPLLIVALGGLFSERSGIVNIGLEGLMVIGSFASAFTIYKLETAWPGHTLTSIYIGILVATAAGLVFSLLHAFASIHLNANQVISGTAINMIAGALTVFLSRNITGSGNIRMTNPLPPFDVWGLHKIPVLGPLIFTNTYWTTWVILLIVLFSSLLLRKTAFGLRLRACGEYPQAAEAAGVNVRKMRYIGVLISGAFAGLGGAIHLVTIAGEFNGTVSGLGFLALAALIFGQWRPIGILGATLFFGFASTIANVSQVIPALTEFPPILLKVFPYAITLIALVVFSKTSQAPKAAGEVFDSGKR